MISGINYDGDYFSIMVGIFIMNLFSFYCLFTLSRILDLSFIIGHLLIYLKGIL